MKLSIITVTYNNEKTIGDYLTSVFKALPKDSEVIIVDSGSTDKTAEILGRDERVNLVRFEENVGYGKGNNEGVKKAQGEFLFFLNPDTKVLGNSINRLLELAEGNPEYGIVAPKLIERNGGVQPSARKLPTIIGAVKGLLLGQKDEYEAYAPQVKGPTEVEAVLGAALLMKKELFEKVGGFDRRYFMYFEDLDLCRKVRRLGLRVVYDPEAEFIHKVGSSYNENKIRWSKESDRIYHGDLAYIFLSFVYLLNRIKNKMTKR